MPSLAQISPENIKSIGDCAKAAGALGNEFDAQIPGIAALFAPIASQLEIIDSIGILDTFKPLSEAVTNLIIFIITRKVTESNKEAITQLHAALAQAIPIIRDLGEVENKTITYFNSYLLFGFAKGFGGLQSFFTTDPLRTKIPETAAAIVQNIQAMAIFLEWKTKGDSNPALLLKQLEKNLSGCTVTEKNEHVLLACESYILCAAVSFLNEKQVDGTQTSALMLRIHTINNKMSEIKAIFTKNKETGPSPTHRKVMADQIAACERYEEKIKNTGLSFSTQEIEKHNRDIQSKASTVITPASTPSSDDQLKLNDLKTKIVEEITDTFSRSKGDPSHGTMDLLSNIKQTVDTFRKVLSPTAADISNFLLKIKSDAKEIETNFPTLAITLMTKIREFWNTLCELAGQKPIRTIPTVLLKLSYIAEATEKKNKTILTAKT